MFSLVRGLEHCGIKWLEIVGDAYYRLENPQDQITSYVLA